MMARGSQGVELPTPQRCGRPETFSRRRAFVVAAKLAVEVERMR
jgi:hypothetical protein